MPVVPGTWEFEFLLECKYDFGGIWQAVEFARRQDPAVTKRGIIGRLRYLLRRGLVMAGDPQMGGPFKPWEGTPEEIIDRIEREWRDLGKDPMLGDITWFDSTPAGNALLAKW